MIPKVADFSIGAFDFSDVTRRKPTRGLQNEIRERFHLAGQTVGYSYVRICDASDELEPDSEPIRFEVKRGLGHFGYFILYQIETLRRFASPPRLVIRCKAAPAYPRYDEAARDIIMRQLHWLLVNDLPFENVAGVLDIAEWDFPHGRAEKGLWPTANLPGVREFMDAAGIDTDELDVDVDQRATKMLRRLRRR